MAKLSDARRNDDEQDDLAMVSFFLVVAFAAVWFIAGVYIGRPVHILVLDALCGVGLLTVLLGAYASLSTRLNRLEQQISNGRGVQEANRCPPFAFDDELSDPSLASSSSSKVGRF
ncbi:hypothetical protein [Brucella pseudintermedia]|uniref:hypothetical protein n=1 Tax=Brucella pseudintermedia TaxID=370111 RepID=UPI00124C9C76|nr:hypothetical protein [Brucella pseudintermedia]KAB2680896.1 hypothetical protein F9K78_14890 [Brucella pseudintermedia]